jgi:hypothetical protein
VDPSVQSNMGADEFTALSDALEEGLSKGPRGYPVVGIDLTVVGVERYVCMYVCMFTNLLYSYIHTYTLTHTLLLNSIYYILYIMILYTIYYILYTIYYDTMIL